MICLGEGLFASILFGTHCASWTCMSLSFTKLGAFSFHCFFKMISNLLLFLFPFWHPYDLNVGLFQVVPEVPQPLLTFFWILVSSFCSSWMFISSFCSKSLIWVPVSFPSLLVPYTFSFISLFIAFAFSSTFQRYSYISVSILNTSVLNSASDRLAIFSSVSCTFFLELWSVLSFGPYFFGLSRPVT